MTSKECHHFRVKRPLTDVSSFCQINSTFLSFAQKRYINLTKKGRHQASLIRTEASREAYPLRGMERFALKFEKPKASSKLAFDHAHTPIRSRYIELYDINVTGPLGHWHRDFRFVAQEDVDLLYWLSRDPIWLERHTRRRN